MAQTPKLRHCFYCGVQAGFHAYWDLMDTCGKRECERQAQYERQAQRDAEHEQLDRDMGWE
jgi:hypothetical protein